MSMHAEALHGDALALCEDGACEIPEAQKLLGNCSRAHIYRLRSEGRLRFIKLGRRSMVPRRQIVQLLAESMR
jgi:excisionase family DNA binding protein